jgi:hypothetical protein
MTIGPGDRKKIEDRATEDRGTKDRGRAHVDFITLRGVPYRLLVNVLPKETVVLDEMSITPSKRYRNQETVSQAKHALAQSKAGKRVAEGDIVQMQQRLLTMEKQAELVGRESEGRQLAEALGEVRQSNLVNKALDTIAKAKKGRVSEGSIETLQKQLMTMEHQDQVAGRETEGQQLALALGEVRRSQLVDEAANTLARAKQGTRFNPRAIDRLQQRLLGMEQQDELFGRESAGRQLAVALGEVRRSQLVAEAKAVLASVERGRKFSDQHIKQLQQVLVSMERQDEIQGHASEGLQLATALAELRH